MASRAWRLQNLYTIRDAKSKVVPFVPNQPQKDFYNRYWYCNHTLKARKLGFSTFIFGVLYLDDLLFAPDGLTAGMIDYTIEDAESKLAMMALGYERLDDGDLHPDTWRIGRAIKEAVPLLSQATRKLAFGNGSVAKCSTSLRGATPQRTHISELGKTAIWAPVKAREIINGAFNSMVPGGVRNIESTHEGGKVGDHYRLVNQAMRHDDKNLTNIQSRFHFFPWWQDARYQLSLAGGHKLRPEIVKYFKRMEADHGIHLSAEQMLWYDHKRLEQGHGMLKEFPSTPGEAFEAIHEGAIYGTEMADLRAKGRICSLGMEANYPIFTFSDLGLSDYFSDWLIQPIGRHGYLVLDWFESEGLPGSKVPDHWLRWEQKWGKPIAAHFLPHDADTRAPGSGISYAQEVRQAGRSNIKIVPRIPDKWIGIGFVRDVLPHCWFNKDFCDVSRNRDGSVHEIDDSQEDYPSGVACLEGYQKDVSAAAGMKLREMPKHDLFSHSADGFRTFAEARRQDMIEIIGDERTVPQKPPVKGGPRGRR